MIGAVFQFMLRQKLFFTALVVVALITVQGAAFAHCPDLPASETGHHQDSVMAHEHAGAASQDRASKVTPVHDQDRSSPDKRVNVCVGTALAIVAQPTSDAPIDFVLLHSTLESQAATGRSIEPQPEPPRA